MLILVGFEAARGASPDSDGHMELDSQPARREPPKNKTSNFRENVISKYHPAIYKP
tara:strand:+ start:61 stop:228 length:168 start_codon:yes stop_codon:yes gene_type:complete